MAKAKRIVCELCGEGKCACNKDIRIYFCPKCKSTNVKYVFGLGNIFGIIPRMKCFKCGNTAPAFPILETNKKEIAKVTKKKKAVKKVKKITKKAVKKKRVVKK